jgi:hypothetical protein
MIFIFLGIPSSNASPRPHKFTINAFQIDGFVKSFRCKARNPADGGVEEGGEQSGAPSGEIAAQSRSERMDGLFTKLSFSYQIVSDLTRFFILKKKMPWVTVLRSI